MLIAEEIDSWNTPDASALRATFKKEWDACARSPTIAGAAALLKAARNAEADGAIADEQFLNALAGVQDVLDALARRR